jgi:hypothetical protein
MALSIQAKAQLRWFALVALLVGWRIWSHAPGPVQIGFGASIALLVASAFVWPRCPHCRARVVQFNAREWVPGIRCWHCGRVYDEEQTPPYLAEVLEAVELAAKLRKKDPAAADRLIANAEARAEAAEARERSELRERAPHDRRAALVLRARLQSELKGLARGRRSLEREQRTDPRAVVGLQNLAAAKRSLVSELAGIEAIVQRLTARDERGDQ